MMGNGKLALTVVTLVGATVLGVIGYILTHMIGYFDYFIMNTSSILGVIGSFCIMGLLFLGLWASILFVFNVVVEYGEICMRGNKNE